MLYQTYINEVHDNVGYVATWLPSLKVSLGDIGVFENDQFSVVGNISKLGIGFVTKRSSAKAGYKYRSAGGVSISAKARGKALVDSALAAADAGFVVKFSKTNAVVFEATECEIMSIGDQNSLGAAILARYNNKTWPAGHIVITELVRAKSVTIIISAGDRAQIELRATGRAGIENMSLSDLHAGLKIATSSNVGFELVAEAGLTPLFRAGGIKTGVFGLGRAQFRQRGVAQDAFGFADIEPRDLFSAKGGT